jgi:hypothetical protein
MANTSESRFFYHVFLGSNTLRIQTYNSELVWELPDGNNYTEVSSSDGLDR